MNSFHPLQSAARTLARVLTSVFACAWFLSLAPTALATVTFPMVTVGNAGNLPDTRFSNFSGPLQLGDVAYPYQIAKYEVTAAQYTEFLNAVAAADPNGLYSTNMTATYGCQIVRSGAAGSYIYSVTPGYEDRPVNNVSFWSIARFVNWLHNGQPTGPQGIGTTETGAYINIGNQNTFARLASAKFVIPTEDEWYKAAYHDKSAGLAAAYFDYATGSNTLPGRDLTESTSPGNNANYYGNPYPIDSGTYFTTKFGEFQLSASPYGTFDQNGNVHEWTETIYFANARVVRGGGAFSGSSFLAASTQYAYNVSDASELFGFRVASTVIPEPASAVLAMLGLAAIASSTRRRGNS
jgi:formylglycine-generating enzyme